MTRLSDSLRGLADRAPLDGVGVSTSVATRRIRRGQRLRGAANATAGLGAAAVIALAVIHPGTGSLSSADSAMTAESAVGDREAMAPTFDAAGSSQLAWGLCGSRPFDYEVPMASDAFSLELGEIGTEVEGGSTITTALTVTPSTDAAESTFQSFGPAYMVLWDGMVVGTGQGSPAVEMQDFTDYTGTRDGQLDLVNCWDGTPLPGGDYELVAYQDFYSDVATDPTLPPVADDPPPLTPVDPAPEPDDAAVTGGATDAVAPDRDSTAEAVEPGFVGPAADAPADRAVSNRVRLTVAGDAVEDPFGQYIDQPAPAVVYPDDYLTPSTARDEYAARAVTGAWDMAAGSQRVIKSGDSLTQDDESSWLEGYYGCSLDGITTPSFPTTSANWPLLSVDATLPGSVGVSYGWVINDNPAVNLTVTNTSGYTLPGFWGEPSSALYLVKDGKVVATSYLTPVDPNGLLNSPSPDGLLEPDASLSGSFLWRDVNGCWTGDTPSTVSPGTYTILSEQDIYLDNGSPSPDGPVFYEDTARSATTDSTFGSDASVTSEDAPADLPIAIAPAPSDGDFEWVSLQVWTSLGTVTLT